MTLNKESRLTRYLHKIVQPYFYVGWVRENARSENVVLSCGNQDWNLEKNPNERRGRGDKSLLRYKLLGTILSLKIAKVNRRGCSPQSLKERTSDADKVNPVGDFHNQGQWANGETTASIAKHLESGPKAGSETPVKNHYSLVKYLLPDAINPKADSHGMRMAKLKSQGSGLLQTNRTSNR